MLPIHNSRSLYQTVPFMLFLSLLLYVFFPSPALSQDPPPELNENCTVSILSRTARVNPGGTFSVPNVPSQPGFFRVRTVCEQDGVTIRGQSEFVTIQPSEITPVMGIT